MNMTPERASFSREEIQRVRERAMLISTLVAVLLLVGKFTAYGLSNSTAVLSDALESIVHIIVTLFTALSVRYAAKPADSSHLYGHGRVVIFSIGLEGALIFAASLLIFSEAIQAFLFGPQLEDLGIACIMTALFAAINLALGIYLVRTGKKYNAPALIANGKHVLTDMWTSVSVLIGVSLVIFTGIVWIDPLAALAAALFISVTGYTILRDVVQELMDEASPQDTERITKLLDAMQASQEIFQYHQLRHRRVNGVLFIEFHALFPGDYSVDEAHERITHVEQKLMLAFGRDTTRVISHIEPLGHTEAHPEEHEEHDPLGDGNEAL